MLPRGGEGLFEGQGSFVEALADDNGGDGEGHFGEKVVLFTPRNPRFDVRNAILPGRGRFSRFFP